MNQMSGYCGDGNRDPRSGLTGSDKSTRLVIFPNIGQESMLMEIEEKPNVKITALEPTILLRQP